jgi:hypothetical protein
MALPFAFTGNVAPTGEELDADLAALGALVPIPCTVSGTNLITMTPLANTPTTSYQPYSQYVGIASATNTGPVNAQVGSLPSLPVYKDTQAIGTDTLTGREIVAGTKLWLMYDPALNSNTGGFHLIGPQVPYTRTNNTTVSLAVGSLPPQSGSVAIVTLSNTSIGDIIDIGFPASVTAGLHWQGYVPNAGTVALNVFNMSAATITPNAGNYTVANRGLAF